MLKVGVSKEAVNQKIIFDKITEEQLKNVSSGCFLITSGRLNSENRLSEHFTLLECSMQKYSWGMSSLWIHQRK